MNDLHYLPAIEAVRLFRARKLSPPELMRAVIDRAETVEPVINAFAEAFYEETRTTPRRAERRSPRGADPPRPLEGLPVAVKEEAPIVGHKNSLGSLALREVVDDHTAPFVQRILDA